jgi:hypothetical protein
MQETLDVEMEMMSIASKAPVEDRRALPPTRRVTIKDEKKDKEALDIESLHKLVKSLANDIIDIKKNVAEESTSKRPWRPFVKRNFPPPGNHISTVDDNEEGEQEENEHDDENVDTSEVNLIWDIVDGVIDDEEDIPL